MPQLQSNPFSWPDFVGQELKPLLSSGRLPEALRSLEIFHIQNPHHLDCLMTLGNLYKISSYTNRYIHSLHYYRRAQEKNRDYAPAFAAEAELQQNFGEIDQAMSAIKRALYADNRESKYWEIYNKLQIDRPEPRLMEKPDLIFYTGHPDQHPLPFPHELNHQHLGGSESVLFLMAKGLVKMGKKVTIFANFGESQVSEGIQCFDLKDFFIFQKTRELPVTIVSRYYQPFLNQFQAKRRILWLHDRATPACRQPFKAMDPQVDEYWMLTHYQEETYQAHCGLPAEKIWYTTNPVDCDLFAGRSPLSSRTPGQLIFASRPDRGLDLSLEIYDELKKEFPHLSLKICTYSTYPNPYSDPIIQPYVKLLESRNISLLFLGKKDLIEEIKKSHVMLYPNTAPGGENCCLASLEAQSAGTPIVTADNGGMKETVEDGKTGFVLPWTGDRQALKAGLIEKTRLLLKNDQLWEQMSKAGPETMGLTNSTQAVAHQWLAHLERYLT